MKHLYFFDKQFFSQVKFGCKLNHLIFTIFFLVFGYTHAQNCTVNAGLNRTICQNEALVLNGSSSGSVQNGPFWSQVGGPSVVITDTNNPNTTVTGFSGGNTYIFRYSATCTIGGDVFQDVSITVEPITIANAGNDIASCPDSSGSIIISANNPANPGETGVWSVVGGNGAGVSINFPTSATTPINLSASSAGTSILRWTITGPDYAPSTFCESFDEITVTNYGGVEPVDAGVDQTLSNCYTATQSTSLSGTFGGNNINGQQGTWSFVSGPNTPTIANVNSAGTSVSGLVEGTYTFRWDVSGPCANGSDTVNIIVPAATQDVSNASIQDRNQRFCDTSVTQTTLVGSDPDFTNETVLWEQIDGNPPVTIVDPTNPTTQVTGLTAPNSYQFRYTIINNITGCTSSDTGRVRYNTDPVSITVNSGNDITAACGETNLNIPFTFTGGNQTQYSIINGPTDSALGFPTSFQNAGGNSVTINSFDAPGTYTISFRRRSTGQVLTTCNEATDDVRVTISLPPTGANAGTSQNLTCGATTGSLAGNVVTVGTSTWSQISGPNNATIADIYASTTGVSNLIPGLYTFRYSISGGGACPVETADTQIFVSSAVNGPSNAGTNQNICFNAPAQLAANSPTDDQIGTWSGPPGIVFEDVNDPNTIATGFSSPSTVYTLQWSVENTTVNCGAASVSTVNITTSAQESPTESNAGADQCLAGGTTTINLTANNPDIDEQGLWTVNPSAGVVFADATQANTTATVPSDGTYIFTWTIDYTTSNGCAPTSDDIEVTIASTALANAGPDQKLCANSFTMAADPANPPGVGTWNLVSGNGGFTVDDINSPTATFSNLLDGTYVFQWRIDYGNCSFATDEVSITVGIPPSTANIPGGNQVICSATSTTIAADAISDPNTESGVWTLLSGAPNTPTITNPSNNNTTVTGLTTGSYTFRWTVSGNSPLCPSTSDEIIVEVYAPADAGPNQDLCEATSVFLEATSGTTGTWSQVANGAPVSTITQSPVDSNTANASVTPGNTYIFEYTTDYTGSGAACNNSDQVTIVVSSGPSIDPDAGPDQDICIADTGGTATLAGNTAPVDVNPATWTFVSEPSGSVAVISSPNSENSTVTGLTVPGLYILQWNFESDFCTDKADIVRIQMYEAPSTANAGADQPNACQLDAQLNATTPSVGIGTWSFANPADDPSGGAAIIDSPNNPNSTLSNITTLGTYVLTWTVSNGPFTNPSLCEPSTDTVAITFTDVPPSQANAGPDQELCNADQTTFEAIPVSAGTGVWDQISGPNIATIASPNNPNSLVFGMIEGVYEFRWTTSNGGCSFEDFVQITILSQPITANAGPNQVVPEFSSITLGATPPSVGQGLWDQVSGPNTATIINPNDPNSQVAGTTIGSYVFRWTVSNGGCPSVSDTVQIEVVGNSDLELTKSVFPASAKVGEVVTFTLAVFNNNTSGGNSNAAGVSVVDAIPAGYTLVAGSVSNGGNYNAGNFTITWNNLSVANGNTLNLTFDATVNAAGSYDNSAEITASNQFDPDSTPGNSVATEDDQSSVAVTIIPNDPPVAVNDESLANVAGTRVNVMILVNDSDADGSLDAA
ncbi:PKD domain-containing protein, partial [Aquimarina sp. 2-A2]|uniref:PKD domain-containing protein n=1 Tax=Aquimarina sp. 2-A2 TaxID=3382644 RepID=UPI00387F1D52